MYASRVKEGDIINQANKFKLQSHFDTFVLELAEREIGGGHSKRGEWRK